MHVTSDGAFQRYTLGPLGLAASLIILAVSASMNYRFGYSLGKSPLDSLIYGWASVGADILKAIAPFLFFAAVAGRRKAVAVAAGLVWVVTTCYGLTSAAGHAALNRLDTTGQRAVAADTYKDTRSDLAEARKALGFIPAHRGESAVRAELEKLKTNRAWSQTNECGEVGGKAERTFCAQYQTLKGELGNAENATKLTARIDALTVKLDKVSEGSGAVMSEADPQASVLARLSRQDVPTVQLGLALLIVLMLEIGGGLGPYASLWYMTGSPRIIDITPEPIMPALSVMGRIMVKLGFWDAPVPLTAPSAATEKSAPLLAVAPAPLALAGPAHGAVPALPQALAPGIMPGSIPPAPSPFGGKEKVVAAKEAAPRNPFLGKPISGSEPELRSLGFPLADIRPGGPEKPADTVKNFRHLFIRVCKAYGLTDVEIWVEEPHELAESKLCFPVLVEQICARKHQNMPSLTELAALLKSSKTMGCEHKDRVRVLPKDRDSARRNCFVIAASRYNRDAKLEEPANDQPAPAPSEVGEVKRSPFASSAAAANDVAPVALKIVSRAPAYVAAHEQWLIAESRRPKAECFGSRSRKQRGSRVHRIGQAA